MLNQSGLSQHQATLQLIHRLWLALATLLVLSLVSSLWLLLFSGDLPRDLPSDLPNDPSSNNLSFSGLELIISLMVAMLITYPLLMLLTQDFFNNIFKPQLQTSPRWILVSLFVGAVLGIIIHILSNQFPKTNVEPNTFFIIQSHGLLAQVLLLTTVAVLAPLFEEYLFRGLILDSFVKRFDTLLAICLSAVVFMCFHLIEYYDYWVALVAMVVLGILVATLRLKSQSMLPPILCHASYNLIIVFMA